MILKADNLRTEEVSVPEWGGVVLVRELSGRARDEWEASLAVMRGKAMVPDVANLRAKLVARSVVGDDGEPVFTQNDVHALGELSAAALDRVFEVASRLSGLGEKDLEELGKASESGRAAGSSSPSQGAQHDRRRAPRPDRVGRAHRVAGAVRPGGPGTGRGGQAGSEERAAVMAEAEVTGSGVLDMKLLAAKLKDADPVLKRELRRNFKAAAEPVIGDVEQSILLMPSHHDGTLRRQVAKTVTAGTSFTTAGVRVQIDSNGAKMPAGKGTLPHHLDSAKGWGHPVWGHGPRSRWHWTKRRQFGKPAWFEKPIADNAREFRAAAQRAIDETEKHLGG